MYQSANLNTKSDEEDERCVSDLHKVFVFATKKKTEASVCMYLKEIGNSSYCRVLDNTRLEEEMCRPVEKWRPDLYLGVFITVKSNPLQMAIDHYNNLKDEHDVHIMSYRCESIDKTKTWRNYIVTTNKEFTARIFNHPSHDLKQYPDDFNIDQTDAFEITPVHIPYVSELLPNINRRHLILKSAIGTGKTQLLVSLLAQQPDAKIISVSSRISLIHNQMGRFGHSHGFKSYLDLKKKQTTISANRLCVSFDSLHKVVDIEKYDIVVLDECD